MWSVAVPVARSGVIPVGRLVALSFVAPAAGNEVNFNFSAEYAFEILQLIIPITCSVDIGVRSVSVQVNNQVGVVSLVPSGVALAANDAVGLAFSVAAPAAGLFGGQNFIPFPRCLVMPSAQITTRSTGLFPDDQFGVCVVVGIAYPLDVT